jgi:hypothetical protein
MNFKLPTFNIQRSMEGRSHNFFLLEVDSWTFDVERSYFSFFKNISTMFGHLSTIA